MNTSTVTRVAATASLADQDGALERAKGHIGSDPDWDEFVEQVTEGVLLPVRFHVTADALDAAGERVTAECVNDDVWLEAPEHLPQLLEDVRVTASKDFSALAAQLRDRGLDVEAEGLGDMYVEVTLDEDLREAAGPRRSPSIAE